MTSSAVCSEPDLHGRLSRPEFDLSTGPAAAKAYLEHAAEHLSGRYPGVGLDRARVTYLDAGIMNWVYRIEAPGYTFFLKQALARVKQHDRLGADLASVSPARIQAEARALAVLNELLPDPFARQVPRLAWYDPGSNVLWTEEIAPGACSLQQALQEEACDARAAGGLGRLLGAVHRAGLGMDTPLWPSQEEDQANWERFLRMRTTGFLRRASLPPAVEARVQALYAAAREQERRGMVSHLDAAPKNVLLGSGGAIALLDFELGAAVSDPAYDPGFLAGHYLLMGENHPRMRDAARESVEGLLTGYLATGVAADSGWRDRVLRYAGLTMLYRLYGSSPAPYLSADRHAAIRSAGLDLLTGRDL